MGLWGNKRSPAAGTAVQLRDGEHCPVHIDSPWGCMETTAVVRRLEIADGQAEAVYELEGDVHRFRLEWTKE